MVASCSKLSLFPLVLPFIGIVSLNAQNIEYCTTPTISSLNEWKSDLRQSSLGASLPPAGTASCSFPKDNQKVLFLGVDGFRAASAAMLPLPNIRRLESMGVFSYWASTQQTGITKSGPGWTSMLTGVEPTKHGVDANYDLSDISSLYPTFLKVAKEDLGKSVAASVVWSPLIDDLINVEDPATLDKSSIKSTDASMASEAKKWIENENYDVIFTDFDGCDAAGHANDFDGYDDEYRAAAIKVDTLIGSLLDAVENRPTINGEEWLFVLTSDHGGEGNSHGSKNPYNRRIPLIVASNSPRVGMGRASSHDPGSHLDVFPTIIHFLGGDLPLDYLDGQVFGFRDYERTPPPQPPACISDPSSCGCKDQNQADYRGTVSTTKAGNTCQRWDSQTPNSHLRTPQNYPYSGLEENYCRNPDNEAGAWCYTIDGPRWEFCDIPACPVTCKATLSPVTVAQTDYIGEDSNQLVNVGTNPACPLYKCQGNCDTDDDCRDGLICYERDDSDLNTPGCDGTLYLDWNYCVLSYNEKCIGEDSDQLVNIGYDPLCPLLNCQGDCDTDDNCRDGLNCYQRDEFESGPSGCNGNPFENWNYCIKMV